MQSLCEMTETCLMSPPIRVTRRVTTWNGLKIYNFIFSKINPCAVPRNQMCPRICSTCPKIKIVYLILCLCHIVLFVNIQYISIKCTFMTSYHFMFCDSDFNSDWIIVTSLWFSPLRSLKFELKAKNSFNPFLILFICQLNDMNLTQNKKSGCYTTVLNTLKSATNQIIFFCQKTVLRSLFYLPKQIMRVLKLSLHTTPILGKRLILTKLKSD